MSKINISVCSVCLKARVEEVVGFAWDVFQPLLFGLIGAEIRVSELEGKTVGKTTTQTNILSKNTMKRLLSLCGI